MGSELENLSKQYRMFLKDTVRKSIDFSQTDQSRGIEPPPIEKPCPPDTPRISLAKPGGWNIPAKSVEDAIRNRRSRRSYTREPLTLDETAFLLWATQGIRAMRPPVSAFRTVPSAGCRHAFETYVGALNIEGLDAGVYRYLPLSHELASEFAEDGLPERFAQASFGQRFVGEGAAVFVWTTIPYRMEWRYGPHAHKVIALDAGHVCQNLYLACEAIGSGTCGVAAYDQEAMDALLRVDGDDEFTIYLAPVGKVEDQTA